MTDEECIEKPTRYRVKCCCIKCNKEWITKLKYDNLAPVKCKFCKSYHVKKLYAWKVKHSKNNRWFKKVGDENGAKMKENEKAKIKCANCGHVVTDDISTNVQTCPMCDELIFKD